LDSPLSLFLSLDGSVASGHATVFEIAYAGFKERERKRERERKGNIVP